MTLDSGNSAYVPEDASLSSTTGVEDDVYTATIVASAGTGTLPTGLYINLSIYEPAA